MKDTEFRLFAEIICEGMNAEDLDRFEDLAAAGFTRPSHWEDVEHEHLEEHE
jgi:hypothetical protein